MPPSDPPPTDAPVTLRSLFREYRGRLLLTYVLFNVENVLRMLQPLVIGVAINGLLQESYTGVWLLVGQHMSHLLIGTLRQMYDTRVFTRIYTEMATGMIVAQRAQQVETSRVAARSALSRSYVDFFERYVPLVIRSAYSIVGAVILLAWYDWRLAPICLGLVVPATWLNFYYARKTLRLSRGLHDELEREVDAIGVGDEEEVGRHYSAVADWRVRLSDAEAVNFAAMEFFVLAALVGALVVFCGTLPPAGDIFAVYRYVLMFLTGMDAVPKIVDQLSRLKDIGTRMTGKRK